MKAYRDYLTGVPEQEPIPEVTIYSISAEWEEHARRHFRRDRLTRSIAIAYLRHNATNYDEVVKYLPNKVAEKVRKQTNNALSWYTKHLPKR